MVHRGRLLPLSRLLTAFAVALLCLAVLPVSANRPDIAWMAGGHSNDVTSVALSPDAQTLASASEDTTVKRWRVSDGALLRTLTGHSDGVSSVAFSPGGQTLASESYDNTINLWRVSDGVLIETYDEETGPKVLTLAYSPNGSKLA
jgi:WD40 repeat protein